MSSWAVTSLPEGKSQGLCLCVQNTGWLVLHRVLISEKKKKKLLFS